MSNRKLNVGRAAAEAQAAELERQKQQSQIVSCPNCNGTGRLPVEPMAFVEEVVGSPLNSPRIGPPRRQLVKPYDPICAIH